MSEPDVCFVFHSGVLIISMVPRHGRNSNGQKGEWKICIIPSIYRVCTGLETLLNFNIIHRSSWKVLEWTYFTGLGVLRFAPGIHQSHMWKFDLPTNVALSSKFKWLMVADEYTSLKDILDFNCNYCIHVTRRSPYLSVQPPVWPKGHC